MDVWTPSSQSLGGDLACCQPRRLLTGQCQSLDYMRVQHPVFITGRNVHLPLMGFLWSLLSTKSLPSLTLSRSRRHCRAREGHVYAVWQNTHQHSLCSPATLHWTVARIEKCNGMMGCEKCVFLTNGNLLVVCTKNCFFVKSIIFHGPWYNLGKCITNYSNRETTGLR